MSRRSNKGLFQRLMEAGSRTTYQGKIRTRGGKRTGTVREGRQRIYKGVRIVPVGEEFETSLDSSRFDSLRDAKRFVDAWKKQGNPASDADLKQAYRLGFKAGEARGHRDESGYRFERDYYRRWASLDKGIRRELDAQWDAGYKEGVSIRFHNPSGTGQFTVQYWNAVSGVWMDALKTDKRWKAEKRAKAIEREGRRVRIEENPAGTKGRFERCVKAVSERGGAVDPRAVCGAQEKKYRKNPEFYLVVPASGGSPVSRHYSKSDADKKRADLESRTGRSYEVVSADVDTRAKHGYRYGKRNPSGLQMFSGLTKSEAERRARKLKSDDSKLRKMGGSGNYDSVEVQQTFEGPGHKEYGVFVTKRNPANAAIAVSEEFHGRKVKAMIPVQQKRHYHKYLAELGELRKLVVHSRDGKHKVTLSKFDGAMLAANEDKNQMFIVGGDQSVNLNDFGIKNPHETETLGEVVKIEYFTDKEHLGDEGGEAVYVHKFRSTNDNGRHKTVRMARNPDLIYHLRDEHLEFSGGSYEIRAEGIDL